MLKRLEIVSRHHLDFERTTPASLTNQIFAIIPALKFLKAASRIAHRKALIALL